MKKLFSIMLLVGLILLSGCEASIEIVGLEIETFPQKIIYYKGIDNELDFSGGKLVYLLKNESIRIRDMNDEVYFAVDVNHNINFNETGVYEVMFYRNENAYDKFPIQVVDLNELELIISKENE